jgi:hypothetical protein
MHLINVSNPQKIKRTKVDLRNNFTVPAYHASIITTSGEIFISGGIIETGSTETKSDKLSKYSLKMLSG